MMTFIIIMSCAAGLCASVAFILGHQLGFARARAVADAARIFLAEVETAGYSPCKEPCGEPWCEKQLALKRALGE